MNCISSIIGTIITIRFFVFLILCYVDNLIIQLYHRDMNQKVSLISVVSWSRTTQNVNSKVLLPLVNLMLLSFTFIWLVVIFSSKIRRNSGKPFLFFYTSAGFHRNLSDLKFPVKILEKFLAFFDHSVKGDRLFHVQDKRGGSFQDSVEMRWKVLYSLGVEAHKAEDLLTLTNDWREICETEQTVKHTLLKALVQRHWFDWLD